MGECLSPDAPNPGKRRPSPGALEPPPQRAKPGRKSVRCGVSDGSPGPQVPAPTTSGYWAAAARPKGRVARGGRVPDPRRPTPRQETPPPGALVPPPQRAKPARKSARCEVHDGYPRPHPLHPQSVGSGPRLHASKDGRSVVGERRNPDAQARGAPPPGTLMPPLQRAKPARKSARGGVGNGSPRQHIPHPQLVGSGPRPHARKDEWSGVVERPTPDAPHPGKRRPPRTPSCHPHSAQSQLARARAVGLVTGPHARTHPTGSAPPQAR